MSNPISRVDFQTVVWKLRSSFQPGDLIAVSARHRFAGADGRFRFVVYQGLSENFETPKLDQTSEYFEAAHADEWSQWLFTTEHPVIFVGVEWENQNGLAPIALEATDWANPLSFNGYAYFGTNNGVVAGKTVPLKADIRLDSPRVSFGILNTPAGGIFTPVAITLLGILGLMIGLLHFSRDVSTANLIVFSTGILFSYRAWAWFGASAPWLWGSSYVSYLPFEVRTVLFAAGFVLLFLYIRRKSDASIVFSIYQRFAILSTLVALAWLYRSSRVYGDYVFGYSNHTHAPLTASLYSALEWFAKDRPWISQNFNELISVVVFVPFLVLVSRMVEDKNFRGLNVAPAFMLISATSLQCFFGYVEVYSVPMMWWMAFALAAFGFLDKRLSIWIPTAVAFVSYLSHVSEAMLLFPLVYLWYRELWHNRPKLSVTALRILTLGAFAISLTALSYAVLFVFKYGADLASFNKEFSHYGFEILAGQHRHAGVVLPVTTSALITGMYTNPGPDYTIFSLDNLMKIVGFQFQYSIFFFLLPVLILVRDRLKPLKDPKIAFVFIALLTYSIYAGFAYVGWLPVIRDWDLFAVYSVIGGTLTYLLLKREENHAYYWLIGGLNLLQTIPWILMNHFRMDLPW